MNDLDIMKRAQSYIESMANGTDPLTGKELPDTDIVNNVRISRCLFYVSDVLKKVIANGGEVQREKLKRADKADFALTDEQAAALRPADDDISLSRVVGIINAQIDDYTMKKLSRKAAEEWLREKQLVKEVVINGKPRYNPSSEGEQLGISMANYLTPAGQMIKYCVFSPEAQQFIFDNIDVIADFARGGSDETQE